jgi:hypothetical protein
VSLRASDVGARALAALHRGRHDLDDQHDASGRNGRSLLRLVVSGDASVSRDGGIKPPPKEQSKNK